MTVWQHGWLRGQKQSKVWTNSLLICSAACEEVPRYWRNHNTECNSFGVFKFFTIYVYWYIFLLQIWRKRMINKHMTFCENSHPFISKFHEQISYIEMFRNKHIDQNIHHKVQPHSHTQDVVFQLNKCYLVNTSITKCNQICKPQVHTVPGFRNIDRQMSRQTSVKMHLKTVCVLLTHSKLVYSQWSKYRKSFVKFKAFWKAIIYHLKKKVSSHLYWEKA